MIALGSQRREATSIFHESLDRARIHDARLLHRRALGHADLMRALWSRCLLVTLLLGAAVGVATSSAPAHAQSRAELARSRTLFEQGLAHAEAGRWSEARQAFESALAITERPSILLNLATAQAETGALVQSAASYRRFLEIATTRDQRQHRVEAEEALANVERRIAHLTLDPRELADGDRVSLDGRELTRTELVSIPLDPGAYTVTVTRGERTILSRGIELHESEARTVELHAPAEVRRVPVPAPREAVEVTEPPPASGGGDDGLAIGLGVGLGVGALVIGAVVVGIVLGTSSPDTYEGNLGSGVIRF